MWYCDISYRLSCCYIVEKLQKQFKYLIELKFISDIYIFLQKQFSQILFFTHSDAHNSPIHQNEPCELFSIIYTVHGSIISLTASSQSTPNLHVSQYNTSSNFRVFWSIFHERLVLEGLYVSAQGAYLCTTLVCHKST